MPHPNSRSISSFVPRPLVLKILERSHCSAPLSSELSQDRDQTIGLNSQLKGNAMLSSMDPFEEWSTITPAQANLIQSQPRSQHCTNPDTQYHSLKCGHTILTSTTWPSVDMAKSACASNCNRSSPAGMLAKETRVPIPTLLPFICPTCIETTIKRNYIKIWKEYRSAGFHPSPEPDINVAIWVYSAIRKLVQSGLRISQGPSGVFLLDYQNEYGSIDFMPSVVEEMTGRWSFRDRMEKARSRSRSPQRFDNDQRVGDHVKCTGGKYRDRSPLRKKQDPVVDGLAERFGDARVGLRKDKEMDSLLEGFVNI